MAQRLQKAVIQLSHPQDEHEQQADRIAHEVTRVPAATTTVQRPGRLGARLLADEQLPAHTAAYIAGLSGRGQPLSDSVRAFMEPRFGVDLKDVRVHADSEAARSAADIRARAYTVGSHIVFGTAEYDPHTDIGRPLLAHELAHVIQQSSAHAAPVVQRSESDEHVALGDSADGPKPGFILLPCHKRDLPEAPFSSWPDSWRTYYASLNVDQKRALRHGLTYGEIVALNGDLYSDFAALERAPLREVIALIPLIRKGPRTLEKRATTLEFEHATGGRYLALADAPNVAHFSNASIGDRNRDHWRRIHIEAITEARAGNETRAWGLNASGDHFLTDAFSGGHIRVPRAELSGKVGGIKSKALHDLEGQFGMEVVNDRGNIWIAYGDGHLDDKANRQNLALTLEAVKLSKQDIAGALAERLRYSPPTEATVFASERLIPRPTRSSALRWSSRDAAREMGELTDEWKVIFKPTVNWAREWIENLEPSALADQSKADLIRMIDVLLFPGGATDLSGVATDKDRDMHAVERLLSRVPNETKQGLRYHYGPRVSEIFDFGRRTRFEIALGDR